MANLNRIKQDYLKKLYEIIPKVPDEKKGRFVYLEGPLYGTPTIYAEVKDATIDRMPHYFNRAEVGIYEILQVKDKILAVVSGYGLPSDELVPIEEFSASVIVKIYNQVAKQI